MQQDHLGELDLVVCWSKETLTQMNCLNRSADWDLLNQMVNSMDIHSNSPKSLRLLLEETHHPKIFVSFSFSYSKCLHSMNEKTIRLNFWMMNSRKPMIEFESTFWCKINFTWIMLKRCQYIKRMKRRLEMSCLMCEMIFVMFKMRMKDLIELSMIKIYQENHLNQNTLIFKNNLHF